MERRLLFFHDFVSPYCHLALGVAAATCDETGLQLRPVPFELYPTPHPLPGPDDPMLQEELVAARRVAGASPGVLQSPARLPRTRKAHEAVAFALAHGNGPALLRGLYQALWVRGLDIARLDILADLGEGVGLEREALHVALGLDEFQADVVREQHAAAAAGITGVPTVQLGSARTSGYMASEELVAWIDANR
jgi:predicted DsbA family dithiol-disulfide isomerase